MRLIDADAIRYDQLLNIGNKEHPFEWAVSQHLINSMPTIEERKTGTWILDRSGAYCCSKCMEPCATYVMMKPRDKFCKMCGSRNEVEHETD